MTRSIWLAVAVACVLGLVWLVIPTPQAARGQGAGGVRWEYRVERDPAPVALNDLGSDGWELVAVSADRSGTKEATVCYLKRRK